YTIAYHVFELNDVTNLESPCFVLESPHHCLILPAYLGYICSGQYILKIDLYQNTYPNVDTECELHVYAYRYPIYTAPNKPAICPTSINVKHFSVNCFGSFVGSMRFITFPGDINKSNNFEITRDTRLPPDGDSSSNCIAASETPCQ